MVGMEEDDDGELSEENVRNALRDFEEAPAAVDFASTHAHVHLHAGTILVAVSEARLREPRSSTHMHTHLCKCPLYAASSPMCSLSDSQRAAQAAASMFGRHSVCAAVGISGSIDLLELDGPVAVCGASW